MTTSSSTSSRSTSSPTRRRATSSLLFIAATLAHMPNAVASSSAMLPLRQRTLPGPPPFDMASILPFTSSSASSPLTIDVMTMPAFGHYMTTRDIAVALALRGHNVTFVLCDRSLRDYEGDKLASLYGIGYRSAGPCPVYEEREGVMAKLIEGGSPEIMITMLESVAELARQMCSTLFPIYEEMEKNSKESSSGRGSQGSVGLPHAIVFDADTYCAMDLSIRFRIPRVARVGTGLRDAYTTPIYSPLYSNGGSVEMSSVERVTNAALILASRILFSPIVLPNVYGRHRHEWLAGITSPTTYSRSPAYSFTLDERRFSPSLLWEGVPTLYNTHWGLEHPRPVAPYEHLIGHTNDFAAAAKDPRVASYLSRWMDASESDVPVPVVYVGLGTLSIVPHTFLETLAQAFSNSKQFRFVWSVPKVQQALLPEAMQAASLQAHEACSKSVEEGGLDECRRYAQPGAVLLEEWAPQVPLLLHPATAVFVAHGGMNGMAEGTFSRLPLLCIPFFSDQPDNCAHAEDHGFGLKLDWRTLTAKDIEQSLSRLANEPLFRTAMQEAWVLNVAAGGIPRAVSLIEASAQLPYGAHLASIPRYHYLPWYQAWNVDVLAAALLVIGVVMMVCMGCWRCCCCKRKEKGGGGGDGGKEGKDKKA